MCIHFYSTWPLPLCLLLSPVKKIEILPYGLSEKLVVLEVALPVVRIINFARFTSLILNPVPLVLHLPSKGHRECECLARLAIPDKIPMCPLTQLPNSSSDYLTLKTKILLRGRGMLPSVW